MLDEFSSVFTRANTSIIPQLDSLSYPDTDQLHFSHVSMSKLLSSLDGNKASGPDNILYVGS